VAVANAADRRKVEAANRREKGARRSETQDVIHVMSEVRGRSLMHRILEKTGCNAPLPFSPNAMNLARDVGVHSVGEWLLAEIRAACPQQEFLMRKEAATVAERIDIQEQADDDRNSD
jgi:hypothetical protein